jgi:hypothetical protein
METFAFYLLKSILWILGFAAVYFLFLQNERYFFLNRVFLISGILSAFIFPLITWHYSVDLQPEKIDFVSEIKKSGVVNDTYAGASFSYQNILLALYLAGVLFRFIRTIWQTIPIIRSIKKSEIVRQGTNKLIHTAKYQLSFSFISYVFVNPSINKTELHEIVNHEQEHIRQKHWIDLLLFELLCTMHWFNPVVWLYGQNIRQNHEYLADKYALIRSSNPGVYHATLLNQVFGGSVISLTNSFNYSFNKKRFKMMKHKYQSPLRKLKLLLILPIIAGIFYAFSVPKYVTESNVESEQIASTKIGNINLHGNTAYTTKHLTETLRIKKGDPFVKETIEENMYEVPDLYLNNGYLFFNIVMKDTVMNKGVSDLTFRIFEGRQWKVRNVDVKGNDKLSTSEMQKIISIHPGELFSRAAFNQSYQDLIKAGSFNSEELNQDILPDLSTQSYTFPPSVDIVFKVVEK